MASNEDRNLIVEVEDLSSIIRIINLKNDSVSTRKFEISFAKKEENFFSLLPSMVPFNQIKALVFNLIKTKPLPPKENYEFRQRCIKLCQKHGFHCFFIGQLFISSWAAISSTKTMVNEGENILIIRPKGVGPDFMAIKLVRKKTYYEIIDARPKESAEGYLNCYMKDFEPKKKYSPISFIYKQKDLYPAAITTKVLQILDKKIPEYDVTIPSLHTYNIQIGSKSLFKVEGFQALPFEKSVIVDSGNAKNVLIYQEFIQSPPLLLEGFSLLPFKLKTVKVTLKIDYNGMRDFNVEEIENILPTNLSKARFIFGKQHFSVTVFDENEKEYVLEDSDGLEKTAIYISFAAEKPVIGKHAMEIYDKKPEFVVYDLIKLCSVEDANIENPKWGFKFFKDAETLKVQMQTLDGEKEEEPAFLLALFFQNGINRISKKFGKRMTEIEIKFDDFIPNEILKNNFVKAGILKEIEIVFV
uniref:Uncharacterized protein n=1 Tax=Panagrolaimus sp. PS1159 TaxID=55785 RepID=A0AC35EV83_9BILA